MTAVLVAFSLICFIGLRRKPGGNKALPRYLRQLRYRWVVAHMPPLNDWGQPILSHRQRRGRVVA